MKQFKSMKTIYNLAILAGACFLAVGIYSCVAEDDGSPELLDLPVISINSMTINEGDEDAVVELAVKLTGNNATNAIVTVGSIEGTAESPADYQVLTTGKILFAPGDTLHTISFNLTGDGLKEPRESFQIKIYNPQNAYVGNDLATITIEDDDNNTAALEIPTSGYESAESYDGYNLVWADEFEGESLDLSSWTYEIGDGCPNNCGWGNNESQYYREDNTSIVDGNLVITAKEQPFQDHDYTSSRLVTKGKRQFKFGRIDIRAALPEGQGIWPALWMLGSNIDAVGWPACGEIDIMELTGNVPNRVVGTVHFGENVAAHQFISQNKFADSEESYQDEFHVYSINWENNLIEFLVDDVVFHTITPASLDGAPYPFNKNFFFIFNIAVGGNWPGYPDSSTEFPQYLIVDYVRVFQK
jgi:beta-glucanase (GH16 family)